MLLQYGYRDKRKRRMVVEFPKRESGCFRPEQDPSGQGLSNCQKENEGSMAEGMVGGGVNRVG